MSSPVLSGVGGSRSAGRWVDSGDWVSSSSSGGAPPRFPQSTAVPTVRGLPLPEDASQQPVAGTVVTDGSTATTTAAAATAAAQNGRSGVPNRPGRRHGRMCAPPHCLPLPTRPLALSLTCETPAARQSGQRCKASPRSSGLLLFDNSRASSPRLGSSSRQTRPLRTMAASTGKRCTINSSRTIEHAADIQRHSTKRVEEGGEGMRCTSR